MRHQILLTSEDCNKCTKMKRVNDRLYFRALTETTKTPVVCKANDSMMALINANEIKFLDEKLYRIRKRLEMQLNKNELTVEEVWSKDGGSLYVMADSMIGTIQPKEMKIITSETGQLGKRWFISAIGLHPAIMIY